MASGDPVGLIGWIGQPAANYATMDGRAGGSTPAEAQTVYDFDDTTTEYLDFYGRLVGYDGGGLTLSFHVQTTSAVTGDAQFGAAFRRRDSADDIDASHTYDYNDCTATTVPGTCGYPLALSITFSNGSDMDSLADGEPFVLRIRRTVGGDSVSGDVELLPETVQVLET